MEVQLQQICAFAPERHHLGVQPGGIFERKKLAMEELTVKFCMNQLRQESQGLRITKIILAVGKNAEWR